MARKIFFNFHSKPGNWRVSQVRKMGVVGVNKPLLEKIWKGKIFNTINYDQL